MQLRTAGIVPLLWLRRGRLDPVQWFLLGGALAGPGLYLVLRPACGGNQYFTRAGFTFGVILSAWGYAMVSTGPACRRAKVGAGRRPAAASPSSWCWSSCGTPVRRPSRDAVQPLLPLLRWAPRRSARSWRCGSAWSGAVAAPRWPALRGRGAVVALTGVLVAGAPGLVMDKYKSVQAPNGGAYANRPAAAVAGRRRPLGTRPQPTRRHRGHQHALPRLLRRPVRPALVLAQRLLRALGAGRGLGLLAADGDRRAERRSGTRTSCGSTTRRSPPRPPEELRELRERYGVRWLVVDRDVGRSRPRWRPSPTAATTTAASPSTSSR